MILSAKMIKKKFKIVLSTLPSEGEYQSWITPKAAQPASVKYIPLGLLSLASNLPGHEVVIIDPLFDNLTIKQTIDKINAEKADIVGFSAVSRRSFALYSIMPKIKAEYVVVGGPHCTVYHDDIIKRGADAVFVGGLADNDFASWIEDPQRGVVVHCATNIKDIKFPNRSLIDYEKYFYSGKVLFESSRRMSMFSSVGCPNKCTFCTVQGKTVQWKNPNTIAHEIQSMLALGAESIHIMDDNFNIRRSHIVGFLDEIENRGINTEWSIRGQVKFDYSLVPRMKKLGMKRIHVGIESLEDHCLKWMGKNQTVKDIEEFCRVMNDNEIEIVSYFIIGTPVETTKYVDSLPDKIEKLKIAIPYVNVLFPEPDTKYYFNLVKSGVYDKDLWKEYFNNPSPDFVIPSPIGMEKQEILINKAEEIVRRFMK